MEPQGLTGKWTSEWMNTNLWSFPLCQFVPSAQLCMVSFHSMLANPSFFQYLDGSFQSSQTSPETGIWKTLKPNSNDLIVFRISSWYLFEYLCQSTQRRLSCNTSFLRSTSLELPFGAWKRSQARPKSAENRSPLSAVSSTCKEITWDKCYGSVRLALFTASLTTKCIVWNCALGKWQCLHNETSVTRSIWIQEKATPTSEVW